MVEIGDPNMCELFAQLGLDNSPEAIEKFIAAKSPIPANLSLHQADFWTPSQSAMLREAIAEDAEWAVVVEHLDSRLRKSYS